MYLPQINIEHSNRGIVQLILKSTVYIKNIYQACNNIISSKSGTRKTKHSPQKSASTKIGQFVLKYGNLF